MADNYLILTGGKNDEKKKVVHYISGNTAFNLSNRL